MIRADLSWPEDPLPMPGAVFAELDPAVVPRPMREPSAWPTSAARREALSRLLEDVRRLKCRCARRKRCVGCQARDLRRKDYRATVRRGVLKARAA